MKKSSAFFKHLRDWIVYSKRFLYTYPKRPELTCYGVGSNAGGNSWGMQTNQKALAAFICASYEPSIDWTGTGLTAESVRAQGIAMLRFTLESHLTGSYHMTDGKKWGHNWISTLGTARMMHAINLVKGELTEADLKAMRRVFISEADYLLFEYEITAGLIENNHPESNIWNGALLYQTACLYPEAPNAEAYKEKAIRFLINGISKESDEFCEAVYDGIKVKDAFVGANMFDTMACNHHRYMNVGYMVICLSNLAMLYFWCRDNGFPLPEAFDHNVLDAWRLIRSCTFEDGRLWRIGGDTRVRYCYCQDYALPMWALMSERYGIDCDAFVEGWLSEVEKEVINNGDGSFLSDRLGFMVSDTPYYFTRLDSDRACTLSMVGTWRRKYELGGKAKSEEYNEWYDAYHGSLLVKSEKRKASFTWIAGERPTATFIPAYESTLAEWQQNMTGRTRSFGAMNADVILEHHEYTFNGGFLTYGKSASESKRFYCEGYRYDTPAVKTIAYAVLPDDTTAISVQRAVSPNRIYERSYASVMLRIPNDIYNGNKRTYYTSRSDFSLKGGRFAEKKNISVGNYVNIENKMGIASLDALTVKAPEKRQIDIIVGETQDSNRDGYGTLYCNDIVGEYSDEAKWFNPSDEIYRCAFAVNIGTKAETEKMAKTMKPYLTDNENLYGLSVMGADGAEYLLILNIGEESAATSLPDGFEVFSGKAKLNSGEAVLCVKRGCFSVDKSFKDKEEKL